MAAVLAVLSFVLFLPAVRYDFVNYDEGQFVVREPRITAGLTAAGVRWAFTTVHASHYIPLTWISFMGDASLHGMNPAGFHLSNVLLHAVNASLLFLVLLRLTGASLPSALTAAVFAVHPLGVETVAWVYERKGLLSVFFMLLTVLAYARYAKRPGPARFLAVLACYLAALLAKPVALCLPVLLLLLDWWPLGRLPARGDGAFSGRLRTLALEKTPLFLLAGLVGVVLVVVFRREEHLVTTASLGGQVANAVVSCLAYLGKIAWPHRLSVVRMIPETGYPWWMVASAAAALAAISAALLAGARRWPPVAAGWLWFLITLSPTLGVLNTGFQAMADRYTYVPLAGVAMAVVWGGTRATREGPVRRRLLAVAAAAALVSFSAATTRQLPYWRDSGTLFRRVLELDPRNWLAWNNLGTAATEAGRLEEAVARFGESARLNPRHTEAFYNLGSALASLGRNEEAVEPLRRAIALKPAHAEARYNLGVVLQRLGRYPEAVEALREAIRLRPGLAGAHQALGVVHAMLGSLPEAGAAFARAASLRPEWAEAHYNLGVTRLKLNDREAALAEYRILAGLDPAGAAHLLSQIRASE